MRYDYSKDLMSVEGVEYKLGPYRKWLMSNHESLCSGHFVKALRVAGKTKFYFDWQTIYHLSQEYGFLTQYIEYDKSNNKETL